MDYKKIVRFHGHECPGLAMGYRMALAGMEALNALRSEDEEIVAIVENNACGVDALQCVTGCTFGKGNLIFRDYGKHVYTLYSISAGRRLWLPGFGIWTEKGSVYHVLRKHKEHCRTIDVYDFIFLDSGSRDACHRSSGMTAFPYCDTVKEGRDWHLLTGER